MLIRRIHSSLDPYKFLICSLHPDRALKVFPLGGLLATSLNVSGHALFSFDFDNVGYVSIYSDWTPSRITDEPAADLQYRCNNGLQNPS